MGNGGTEWRRCLIVGLDFCLRASGVGRWSVFIGGWVDGERGWDVSDGAGVECVRVNGGVVLGWFGWIVMVLGFFFLSVGLGLWWVGGVGPG